MHQDVKELDRKITENLNTISKLVAVHDEQLRNLKYVAGAVTVAVAGVVIKLILDTIMKVN